MPRINRQIQRCIRCGSLPKKVWDAVSLVSLPCRHVITISLSGAPRRTWESSQAMPVESTPLKRAATLRLPLLLWRAVFELWRRRVAGCNQRRGLVAVNHTHIMQQSHQCIGKQRLPVTHLAQPCPGDGFSTMTHTSATSASGGRLGLGREQLIHKVDIQDKQQARDVKGSTWQPFWIFCTLSHHKWYATGDYAICMNCVISPGRWKDRLYPTRLHTQHSADISNGIRTFSLITGPGLNVDGAWYGPGLMPDIW